MVIMAVYDYFDFNVANFLNFRKSIYLRGIYKYFVNDHKIKDAYWDRYFNGLQTY